jgi:hypothetical protein
MFARGLQKHLKYPIGVIESDWGGTPIEVWSGPDAVKACPSNVSFTPCVSIYFNKLSDTEIHNIKYDRPVMLVN